MNTQILILVIFLAGGCKMKSGQSNHDGDTNGTMVAAATMTVSSSAFQNGSVIPKKYSCEGDNV